ncbi:MAG: septal ring lytic transglycosylase RlpA family protein [Cyanobacteria bacterium]|nr:septal ring lytic transglycosylase RlpA family protein [Cyanobacteriota bacterium]
MNQRLFRSLTAAVVVSAVSALPSHAQQTDRLEELFRLSANASDVSPEEGSPPQTAHLPQAEPVAEEPGAGVNEALLDAPGPEATQHEANQDSARQDFSRRSDLVRVITHPLDDRQAATLYVQNIPVLTFIGPELSTLNDTKAEGEAATVSLESDPAVQATAIAATLDQFHQTAGDAAAISVRWDADQEAYVIALADQDLVAVGESIILPDTTNNAAVDALQATNRLRRLLGGAEPLAAVEGQPDAQTLAANWDVVSVVTGRASWYGPGFHGRRTASGEVFNQNALTAAHRTLPFGTVVRVTNLNNNRQVVVRINDRGPFSGGRILDLSAGAAREIGLDRAGVGPIRLEVLSTP